MRRSYPCCAFVCSAHALRIVAGHVRRGPAVPSRSVDGSLVRGTSDLEGRGAAEEMPAAATNETSCSPNATQPEKAEYAMQSRRAHAAPGRRRTTGGRDRRARATPPLRAHPDAGTWRGRGQPGRRPVSREPERAGSNPVCRGGTALGEAHPGVAQASAPTRRAHASVGRPTGHRLCGMKARSPAHRLVRSLAISLGYRRPPVSWPALAATLPEAAALADCGPSI